MRSLFLAAVFSGLLFAPTPSAQAQATTLIDYELEDQFGAVHRRADVEGRVVVLIGGDREGGTFVDVWRSALADAVGDHPRYDEVSFLMHADLRAVPRIARRFVRSRFVDDPDRWFLMDWSGRLAGAYEFETGRANVLVFAPDGVLAYRAAVQEADVERVGDLAAVVRALLDATAASP